MPDISGYRNLSQEEIKIINDIKAAEKTIAGLRQVAMREGADGRWTAIAQTHFDQGFMALVRSIAKPE